MKFSGASQGREKTRQAQDLLERWSSQSEEETQSSAPSDSSTNQPKKEKTYSPSTSDRNLELNSESFHSPEETTYSAPAEQTSPTKTVPFPQELSQPVVSHSANKGQVDVQSVITRDKPQNTNWIGLFGQFLAYGGVGLLTVGTCMILMGYFGGKEGLAPQGWLISTIGQMSLLLGIVTLVSSGIEQSSNEVTNHIASLDDRIMRIEMATLANYSSRQKSGQKNEADNSSPDIPAKAS